MTYGEFKETEMYMNAEDINLCVNGENPIDEMYYPEELDHLQVIGTGHFPNGNVQIDLVCSNWDKRFEPDWIAES